MTKELSKQICGICGISIEKSVNLGWTYPKYKYLYLDFSEPTNFVKLLELPLDNNNTLGGFINEHFVFANRETFLKSLKLAFLKKPSIKQAIREEQWKYE